MCFIVDVYLTRPQNIFLNDYWQCLSSAAVVLLGNQSHCGCFLGARSGRTEIVLAESAARAGRHTPPAPSSCCHTPFLTSAEWYVPVMPNVSDSKKSVKTWIWILTVQNTTLPPRASVLVYELPHPLSLSIRSRAFPSNRAPCFCRLTGVTASPTEALCFLKDKRQDSVPDPFPTYLQEIKWSIRGFYTESCLALTKVSSRTPVNITGSP